MSALVRASQLGFFRVLRNVPFPGRALLLVRTNNVSKRKLYS